ncbi:MAG: ImuA family protein [Planctomycetaceae bacterium]
MVTFSPVFPVPALSVTGQGGVTTAGQLLDRGGDRETVATGWPALDGLLPGGGVRRGSLVEWLAGTADGAAAGCVSGAATLACAIACRLAAPRRTRRGGMVVVIDRAGWFHPPAVLPWLGADATSRLVVARPSRDDDEIWTIEQALRCAGVAAVVAWPRLAAAWSLGRGVAVEHGRAGRGSLQQWTTAMRRWQLAARSGGAVGLFVRSPAALGEPSWAESRLDVSPLPGGSLLERRLRITRVGGAWCGAEPGAGRPVEIVIDLAVGSSIRSSLGSSIGRAAVVAKEGVSCRAS